MKLKKLFAGIVAVIIIASMLPLSAFAATDVSYKPTSPGRFYNYSGDNRTIDIYYGVDGTNIVKDVNMFSGAIGIGVKFKVSNIERLKDAFDAHVELYPNEPDPSAPFYSTPGDETPTIEKNGEYTVWATWSEPLELNKKTLLVSLAAYVEIADGASAPDVEVLEITVRYQKDPNAGSSSEKTDSTSKTGNSGSTSSSGKTDSSNKTGSSGSTSSSGSGGSSGSTGSSGGSSGSGSTVSSDNTGKTENTDKINNTDTPDNTTDAADNTDKTEATDKSDKADKADKTDKDNKTDKTNKTDKEDENEPTEGTNVNNKISGDVENDGPNSLVLIIVIVVAVLAIAGGLTAFFVIKKKKAK